MRRHLSILLVLLAALTLPAQPQNLTLPQKPNSVRFAVIGDMGTGSSDQYETAKRMAEFHQKFPFDFVIMVGDNIYGSNGPKDMEKKFSIPYKALLDGGVKFYAALGNHDDPNERFYALYNMNGQQYYTFKQANVRFFVIDSNYMDPKQQAWLAKELQASGSEWKIAYFHHPLYSSGSAHGSSLELRQILEPLFQAYGVRVVFSGHDHNYERVKPQKGIHYFTEGSSGKLMTGNLKQTAFKDAGFDRENTFMLVEIAGDEMYFQTISQSGGTVDSGIVPRTDLIKAEAKPGSTTPATSAEPGATKAEPAAGTAPAKPASATESGTAAPPEKTPPAATTAPAKPAPPAVSKAIAKAPVVVATATVGTAKTSPAKTKATSGKVVAKAQTSKKTTTVAASQAKPTKATKGKVVAKAQTTKKTTAIAQAKKPTSTRGKTVAKAKTPQKRTIIAAGY